jgi:glucosamine--fructose-6-phosphate aminotransferase (isomerizing)
VIPHLIEEQIQLGVSLEEACRFVFNQLQGSQAIVVLSRDNPMTLIATRIGCSGGIALAKRPGEVMLASDLPALLNFSNQVMFLAHGEMVVASPDRFKVLGLEGTPLERAPQKVSSEITVPTKEGYEHFTLKEIMGQTVTVYQALRDRVELEPPGVILEGFPFSGQEVRNWRRVVIIGMGTSYYAAQVGRFYFEQLARIPAEVDNASEFRYRDPLIDGDTLVVSLSQSGETADTLAGMAEAKRKGSPIITLCNVPWSQSTWVADYTLYLKAGLERGVASTKCFTSSLVCLYLLAAYIGKARGVLQEDHLTQLLTSLLQLPSIVGEVLSDQEPYQRVAAEYCRAEHFFYLGRGINYPLAMEGALKLKEISYIHAEGYPAGEMKHGPIALIDKGTPVLAIALQGAFHEKMKSNIAEMKARGGRVVALATWCDDLDGLGDENTLRIPPVPTLLSPVVAAVPLQLLAYYMAKERGCDVDMPKNLAKSVTVE